MKAQQLTELIRKRRAIFPNTYTGRPIPREVIEQILENANWAPTHRLTEPWRFIIFTGESRRELSQYLGNWYRSHTPADEFSDVKLRKTTSKPLQSAAVIAICMQRDPDERVPEWEEIAAVACAVQNMWLTCTSYGIGCYWSTPQSILEAAEFLKLPAGQRCLGLFYMGYHEMPELPGKRGAIQDKVVWRIDT